MTEPPAESPAAAEGPAKVKLQPYVPRELAEAARDAWWHTRNQADGFETFSDLMEAALRAAVQDLQDRHNEGRPFPPRPRRHLRTGRPSGR